MESAFLLTDIKSVLTDNKLMSSNIFVLTDALFSLHNFKVKMFGHLHSNAFQLITKLNYLECS